MKTITTLSLTLSLFSFSSIAVRGAEPVPAPSEAPVQKLIDQLGAPDGLERLKAVDALGAMGPRAKAASAALMNALAETTESDHPAVREAAKHVAKSLYLVDPQAVVPPEILTRLAKRAKHAPSREKAGSGWTTQCVAQTDAIETLGLLGPMARSVQPQLVRLSSKACVQGAAVNALRQMGDPAPEGMPEILRNLTDSDPEVRQATLEFIQGVKAPTSDLVLLVGRALNDSVSAVRLTALETLEKIHPEGEGRLPLLAPFLKDGSKVIRERALDIVGSLGPDVPAAVPIYVEALKDSDVNLRLAAARLLAKVDPRHEGMITTLLGIAKEPGSPSAEAAANLLRDLPHRDARIQKALAPYQQRMRRRKVQEAWAASTPEQRQENTRSLRVVSIKMAGDVIDEKPVKVTRHFPAHPGTVVCWTEVSVSSGPAGLRHVWLRDGKVVKEHFLEVLSANDRVWSSEPVRKGRWKVEVRTETAAEPLATINFTVGE